MVVSGGVEFVNIGFMNKLLNNMWKYRTVSPNRESTYSYTPCITCTQLELLLVVAATLGTHSLYLESRVVSFFDYTSFPFHIVRPTSDTHHFATDIHTNFCSIPYRFGRVIPKFQTG